MNRPDIKISVVTPTFLRPKETLDLLENLSRQTQLPFEIVLVDGAPPDDSATELAVKKVLDDFPFEIRYVRVTGGTAVQRNAGIDLAAGDLIALIDDDVRLEEGFLETICAKFCSGAADRVGGIAGYRTGRHFRVETSDRWRWYKRLRLLTTFEPGKYDFQCGYPINNYLQPPFSGVRSVDFMTTACAVWRREVFEQGLRFHRFFEDYGVLEDAHFSLQAGRRWDLLQCGDAKCEELNSPSGRTSRRRIGYKCVVNYYFVFQDIARPLSFGQKARFWRYQFFELFRLIASAARRHRLSDLREAAGRIEGMFSLLRRNVELNNEASGYFA